MLNQNLIIKDSEGDINRDMNSSRLVDINSIPNEVGSKLDIFLSYHLSENHLSSSRTIILQQSALLFLALVGLLYATPAEDNSSNETVSILNVIGTCFTACIIPCTSTMLFYQMHVAPQHVPEKLKNILIPPLASKDYIQQNIIIGFFALLSAVPFATVVFAFQLQFNQPSFIVFIIYVLIANTLLHFLPVKLTLADPIYGALPSFLYKIALYLVNAQPITIDSETIKFDHLKSNFKLILKNAETHFLNELTDNLSEAEKELKSNQSSYELLKQVLLYYKKTPELSAWSVITARILGIFIVCTSCLGYLANPYLVFVNNFKFSPWSAALCTLSPMYFLGILLAFWGDQLGQRLLSNIMLQGASVVKLSVITKLYPTTMKILMTINASLVYFSAAAAIEMMRIAFQELVPSVGLNLLYIIAHLGMGLMAWYAPLDYEKTLIGYFAQYGSQEPQKSIMEFKAKFEALIGDIDRLKSEYVMELVQALIMDFTPDSSELLKELAKCINVDEFHTAKNDQRQEVTSAWGYKSFCPCFYQNYEDNLQDNDIKEALLSSKANNC